MDAEQTIAEIELLERMFALSDMRPLSPNDLSAANRRLSALAAVWHLVPFVTRLTP